MSGARKAGREAVMREAASEMQRESRGMKNGGLVTVVRRAVAKKISG
jgi:hypothetical protein